MAIEVNPFPFSVGRCSTVAALIFEAPLLGINFTGEVGVPVSTGTRGMKVRGDSGSWEGYAVDDEQLSMLQLTLIWTASTLPPPDRALSFSNPALSTFMR